MSMKELYSRAKFWTYFMSFGPSLPIPRFTLSRISGSGFAVSFWTRSASWSQTQLMRLNDLVLELTRMPKQWSSRWWYQGTHRGIGSTSRRATKALRAARIETLNQLGAFQELMAGDPELVGVAHYAPGAQAYRKLSWASLEEATVRIKSKYFPGDAT